MDYRGATSSVNELIIFMCRAVSVFARQIKYLSYRCFTCPALQSKERHKNCQGIDTVKWKKQQDFQFKIPLTR